MYLAKSTWSLSTSENSNDDNTFSLTLMTNILIIKDFKRSQTSLNS